MFVVALMGSSVLVTYFFGFIIGFMTNVFMFVGVIIYIQRRESKEIGLDEKRQGAYYAVTKPSFVCLTCGGDFDGTTCRRCGSHMKKAVFK